MAHAQLKMRRSTSVHMYQGVWGGGGAGRDGVDNRERGNGSG